MEVAIGGNGGTPFQREVREWQRVDPNTGALLTGRLEADRWINGPLNAYGKVVDSQNVSQPNGTQLTQRKQLEVLQARTSSGSLQVVRAQTVQTSSSRWSSSGTRTAQSLGGQRISNGIPLTNGYHPMPSGTINAAEPSHFGHHSSLMTEPSLKLSSLMKSTTTTNDGRISPHSTVGSSSTTLMQKHRQQLQSQQLNMNETLLVDSSRIGVGVGGFSSNEQRTHPISIQKEKVGADMKEMENAEEQCRRSDFPNEKENSESKNLLRHLHRGRSVSTDDLAADWDQNDDDTEPSEWRRVSKIRRSFQFPKSVSPKQSSTPPRPLDLPENSVSVSRIRKELENGRRLNTAMRNNHIDLVALDHILNGFGDTEHKSEVKTIKKATFLTAESLQEIRGKLKKLSDESLYKDDFITQKDLDKKESERNDELSGANTILDYRVQQPVVLQDSHVVQQHSFQHRLKPPEAPPHTTNSLENRGKYRDTSSAEWHLRRKSYGFEKMAPPQDTMFGLETSTDSGIGRSSDLGNWSPTERNDSQRGTIITFNDRPTSSPKTTVTLMNGQDPSILKPIATRRYHDSHKESPEIKRHSIAVDETKYVREKEVFDTKTSIHLNGFYQRDTNSSSQNSSADENGKRPKRVEFCKTEVHFAAESGRVNIVETDGKPPPTNNFRRRRRTASTGMGTAYLEAISSGVPVIHFGDEKKPAFDMEAENEDGSSSLKGTVTVSTPYTTANSESIAIKTSPDDDEEPPLADEISLRGILKNKPVKPKPYHLGENIDSGDSLWGVRLKPVTSEFPSAKRLSPDDSSSPPSDKTTDIKINTERPASTVANVKSVAERVRIVEQRKSGSGYSTKINLNLSDSPYSWESPNNADDDVGKLHFTESLPPAPNRSSFETTVRRNSHLETVNEELKSTSLIMKTMRSANQFDEAMKRLSISDENDTLSTTTTHLNGSSTSRLICNMNAIVKSNSANSIFYDSVEPKTTRTKYASSLDGDNMFNGEDRHGGSPLSGFSGKTFRYERFSANERHMEVVNEEPRNSFEIDKKPVAAPRVRVIGSSNAINHQLSQLRRMYEANDHDSDDSAKADEEVNLYLGGGLASASSDERVTEVSGSWSRVKAKRTSQRQTIKGEIEDFTKTNVMSIEIHSPVGERIDSARRSVSPSKDVPVAHPRNLSPVKAKRPIDDEGTNVVEKYEVSNIRKAESREASNSSRAKAPLKMIPGGARKLRDHELSYFGVKITSNDAKYDTNSKDKQTTITTTNTETNRKVLTPNKTVMSHNSNPQKWKLSSDKPDLLRHSPIVVKSSTSSSSFGSPKIRSDSEQIRDGDDGPIYENLKKPSSYNRKKDLQRDEMNLTEMSKAADLSLKPISSDVESKETERKPVHKSSKTLDTIDERRSIKSQQGNPKIKHVVETRRSSTESIQRPCRSNRPSSASSNESLPRSTTRVSRSEKADPATKKRSSTVRECSRLHHHHHRSMSRDAHHSNASSSEDLSSSQRAEPVRRIRRVKPKEKIIIKSDDLRHRSITTTTRTSTESDDCRRHRTSTSGDLMRNAVRRASSKPVNKTERSSTTRSRASSSTATAATLDSQQPISHHHHHHQHHQQQHGHTIAAQSHQQTQSRSKSSGLVTTTTRSPSSKHTSRNHTRK